jgi:uroporphyrinogen-III synthase
MQSTISNNRERSFESILTGKLFISTRPENRSGELREYFTRAGAELLELPMIDIEPIPVTPACKENLGRIEEYDWVIFTSENGVRHFMEEYINETGSCNFPGHTGIAAIGHKTARVLGEYSISPWFVSRFSNAGNFSEELLSLFNGSHPRVLWPTGSLSPGTLTMKLHRFCDITRMDLYRTVIPEKINRSVLQLVNEDRYDIIFFFSPSAVHNFCSASNWKKEDKIKLRAACIGPVTRDACLELGINPLFMSLTPDSAALFESTLEYYRPK